MQSDNSHERVHQGREKTDKSLSVERSRADQSLDEAYGAAKKRTDGSVRAKRNATDAEVDKIRNDVDKQMESGPPETSQDQAPQRFITNDQLENERRHADATIRTERALVDSVISAERHQIKSDEHAILREERDVTDKDLASERFQTDSSFQDSAVLLSNEQQAHQRTKADLLTRDEFLAIVSHDLRNPIGTILSCSDMLLNHPSSPIVSSEGKKWIEIINRNAGTAIQMINDLLDVERMAAGRLELHMEKHDVGELIRQAVENFADKAAARQIQLESILPEGSRLVSCDRERIKQVVSNLMDNAIKFTRKFGVITLELRNKEDGDLEISVSDMGQGIPESMRTEIFERFFQLGNRERSGLGLGLYISRKIIDAHQGKLWVEPRAQGGSRFTFTLPEQPDLPLT
ncbi:sensor histidine kinase [Oligoflexus tunisiensis]|uniref:sensor histidine kinase n=1 Tax=Oligoflexus tunisiensis TaxID=708132 RepID=UPI00114CB52B|nr:HAMP domain-containing sensor histidine kinase [Oligoflexus tunisiensis]